jgi:predicted site-specific integrase-resolvase
MESSCNITAVMDDYGFAEQVTVKQLADVLGVSISTVHYQIKHDRIAATRTYGGILVIARDEAVRVVQQYRRRSTWGEDS